MSISVVLLSSESFCVLLCSLASVYRRCIVLTVPTILTSLSHALSLTLVTHSNDLRRFKGGFSVWGQDVIVASMDGDCGERQASGAYSDQTTYITKCMESDI